ncbi:MAG: hypothetical protein ABL907_14485, partial [Hyphomicrobium sp.]
MRKTLAMAAIALAALTTTTVTASAWECQGPAHVCGSSDGAGSYTTSKSQKTAQKTSKKAKSYSYAD